MRHHFAAWTTRLAIGLAALALLAAAPAGADEDGPSIAGQLLIASPSMGDPRFAETVIFMVKHDKGGAMGIVVNRPVAVAPLAEMLEATGQDATGVEGQIVVRTGGPVEQRLGFMLHSTDYKTEDSIQVTDRIALSTRPEVLADVAQGKGPRRLLLAFGYAGWGPGQLEGEMARRDWVTAPADDAIVFDDADVTKWQRASARRGIDL